MSEKGACAAILFADHAGWREVFIKNGEKDMDRRTLAIINRMWADLMLSYVTDYRYEDMEHLRRRAIEFEFPGPFMQSVNSRLETLDMKTISQTGVPFITELYNTFAELAFPYTYKSVPMLFFLGILMGTRVEPYLPYPGTAGYQSFNNAEFGCYQGLDLPGTTGCVRPLFTNSHIQLNRERIWVHGKSITDNNSRIPWATAGSPVTVADLRHYRFLNHFVRLETVSEPTTTCPSARLPLAPRPALSTLMSTGARPPTSPSDPEPSAPAASAQSPVSDGALHSRRRLPVFFTFVPDLTSGPAPMQVSRSPSPHHISVSGPNSCPTPPPPHHPCVSPTRITNTDGPPVPVSPAFRPANLRAFQRVVGVDAYDDLHARHSGCWNY